MSNAASTLNEMLERGKIVIPIIQRDYVQGSNMQEERRNEFVEALISTLKSDTKIQSLDFVYGRTNELEEFLPLDGQQRLTTLFLLTWFLYRRAGKYSEIKDLLKRFSYKTRISTTSFCDLLVDFSDKISDKSSLNIGKLSDIIRDNIHYDSSWDSDPTIQAMLDLLDYLQTRFNEIDNDDLMHMYERLRDGAICFDLLDMNEDGFKMTDELYIKMNARGKQLTEFENFKAWFIDSLENNCAKELKEEFCEKIEYDWTQLFWPYSIKKWKALTDQEREDEKYPTIDEMIQNFVEVISELLFFKDNLNSEDEKFNGSKKQYTNVYFNKDRGAESESNLRFLFDALDFFFALSQIDNQDNDPSKIEEFFNNFFTLSPHLPDDSEKVRLFGQPKNGTNLFEECIYFGLDMEANRKILLFCLLYASKNHSPKENRNYIRVVRNLLEMVRQKNDTAYNTNIRINHFGSYWKLLKQLSEESDVYSILRAKRLDRTDSKITESAIDHEKEKANLYVNCPEKKKSIFSLEDNEELRGNLNNLQVTKNCDSLSDYAKYFYGIFNSGIEDSLIVRTLIAFGYEGLYIKYCKLGDAYFFGNKPNWDVIFTFGYDNSEQDCKAAITAMLNGIIANPRSTLEETMENLVTCKNIYSNDEWQYYFLKYKDFYSETVDTKNYYAWNGTFEVRKIKTIKSPLLAKHINPYVLTVAKALGEEKCSISKCMKQYEDNSPLVLENGVSLTCTEAGWIIADEEKVIPPELLAKYSIGEDMCLKHNEQDDRIQIAIKFCNELGF